MLIISRLILGLAFLHVLQLAHDNALSAPMTGDLANAGYLALAVILALANAAVWAPAFGSRVAGSLTGMFTEGTEAERENRMVRLLRWCERRGARRWAVFLALLEGVRHPDRPTAFLAGLRCARPGSRLERIFAAELWRFDGLPNCLLAFRVLQRHGRDPRPHPNQEVNLALLAQEREPHRDAPVLAVPAAQDPPIPRRDPRIRLFETPTREERPPSDRDLAGPTPPDAAAPPSPPRSAP